MADNVVTALLGPTNTGKTHRAVERMLEHESGMIGLPLRLLARELYDRVSTRVGEQAVALVTGEEKRTPPRARYVIATVEAMPMNRDVEFVAIDEIQLAAHPERGHVFTDRLLRARGRAETWFMGSDTMRPLLQHLLPTAEILSFPRLSRLRAAASRSLPALPPRSAVVAFSMSRVYELAERLRRRRGGAAVVLGALSPRTRNAQVALFQAREVDYMVATDAIGMGLNLDLEHVAFADLDKFDGREVRSLSPAELAQIAGRAGRYQNDGSFGTVAPLEALPPGVVRAIENHEFTSDRSLFWRNADLEFGSLDALIASLKAPAPRPCLRGVERAEDFAALTELARMDAVRQRARGSDAVSLLWDVCRIPDYRRLLLDQHTALLSEIYLQLAGARGRLERDWLRRRIDRLDDTSGDIDSLLARLDFIRTWTYVSYQSSWIDDPEDVQASARAIEDRLSDALHDRLVERFVERRRTTAHLATASELQSPFVKLVELKRALFESSKSTPDRWLNDLVDAQDTSFDLDERGRITAHGSVIATLARGIDVLHPEVVLTLDDEIGAGSRARLLRRLVAFSRDVTSTILGGILPTSQSDLSAAGRGLVYQLGHGLGTVRSREAAAQLGALTDADRAWLDGAGVAIGKRVVYVAAGLSPKLIRWRAAFARAWLGVEGAPELPPDGESSFRPNASARAEALLMIGYPLVAGLAIRADVLERLSQDLDRLQGSGRAAPLALAKNVGCSPNELLNVARAFGRALDKPGYPTPSPAPRRRKRRRRRGAAVAKLP
jgi:ATP-dependent RNA helicase SUPV3L1/SUV3